MGVLSWLALSGSSSAGVVLVAAGVSVAACSSDPTTSPGPSGPKAKLLVVTHVGPGAFRHASIPVAERTLTEIGQASGVYEVSFARTAEDVTRTLTPSGLAGFDGVFFANTAGNLDIPDLGAFLDWISAGHAFIGAHAASDTYHDAPRYIEMLGGEFLRHGVECEPEIKVEDASHPAVAHLAPSFRIFDEIYEFKEPPRPRVTVLFATLTHPPDGHPEAGSAGDFPLSWTRAHGRGRVFYTALGHREDVWQDQRFRDHLLGAIRWAVSSR